MCFSNADDIDLFVGGLSEPPNKLGGQLGETFSAIVVEQMKRLKFGDRFFFTHNEPVGFTDSKCVAPLKRPRCTVGLGQPTRSVATGNKWIGPVK